MKNVLSSATPKHAGRQRLFGLAFWLALLGGLMLAGFFLTRFLGGTASLGRRSSSSAPRLQWLLTRDGERRGVVLESDLRQDGAAWELWGHDGDAAPLAPIDELCPSKLIHPPGIGLNGGYWNEYLQPVGVCAGEKGIYAARSHPNGFAIAGGRAWIGPLTTRVRLSPLASDKATSAALELPLNPRPVPRRGSCLIDPAAYANPIKLDAPAQIVWLKRGNRDPLRFNSALLLEAKKITMAAVGAKLELPPRDTILWIRPAAGALAAKRPIKVGDRYRLELTLKPVQGEVRLATCAGPRLIKSGRIMADLSAANMFASMGAGLEKERTWRTAVGCDQSGQHLWVVLLARGKDGLAGATLEETAQTLLELGAFDAMNLDGGSSTSIWSNRIGSELLTLFPLQLPIHHALFLRKDLVISPFQE